MFKLIVLISIQIDCSYTCLIYMFKYLFEFIIILSFKLIVHLSV